MTPTLSDETASSYFGYSTAADFVEAVLQETNRKHCEDQIWDYFNNNVWATNVPSSEIEEYSDFLYNKYLSYAENNAYKYDGDVDKSSKGITSNDALKIQEFLLKKIASL